MKTENQDNTAKSEDEASVVLKEELYQAVSLDPELRDRVSSEVLERLSRNPNLIRSLVRTETITGPFPPPDILEQYNQVLPGAAERIFSLTEREQQHRHDLQKKAINGALNKDRRGQWMGFGITVLVLFIACYFAYIGNSAFAMTLVTIDMVALAAVFAIGRSVKPAKKPENTPEEH